MTETRQPPARKDAQRNRDAILCAARELFAQSGDAPMYAVARQAGVGQATLYRNFPDRAALAAALFAEQLGEVERLAEEHADDPAALFVVLRSIVGLQARFYGLLHCLDERAPGAKAEAAARLVGILRAPLRDAKAAGMVRRDLTMEDVLRLFAMVEGALRREGDAGGRAAAAARVLELVLDGVAAPASVAAVR